MTGPLPFVDPGMNGVSEIGHEGHRLRALAAEIEFQGGRYKLFVLHSLASVRPCRDQLLKIFLGAVPLTLFIAGLAGYWLTRRRLGPMVEMTRRAEKITAENLSERLSINNRDEVGKLTRVINELLGRLESAFEQQTPVHGRCVARIADAVGDRPRRIGSGPFERQPAAAEYRESLAVVNDESNRLTKIVEDLHACPHADAGQVRVEFAMVYLDEIVAETARSVRVLANEKHIAMNIECQTEMPAKGDEALLRRLFLNLLDNAIKYSPASGRVTIRCDTSADAYRIEVTNAGRPIPPGERKNIFERFYRVDKARSRSAPSETSRRGLGLPMTRNGSPRCTAARSSLSVPETAAPLLRLSYLAMAEPEQRKEVEADASGISRIFGRVLRLFGWRLLLGLMLSTGSLLFLFWLTGEVFEGDTAVFDERLRTFVHGYSNPLLTVAIRLVSFLGSTVFLVTLGILNVIVFAFLHLRRELVIFTITMAGEIFLDLTMKAGFMRARPEPFYPYPPLESYSYPSGHALASFCFYGITAWLVATRTGSRRAKVVIWSMAVSLIFLIGLSRIYLGVHYPSDVIAGYLTALIWTFVVAFGDRVVRRKAAHQGG